MDLKKFSLKNFINDLPKMLNFNFTEIEAFIKTVFKIDDKSIELDVDSAKVSGQLTASTVNVQNLTATSMSGNTRISVSQSVNPTLKEIIDRITALENENKALKDEINKLRTKSEALKDEINKNKNI